MKIRTGARKVFPLLYIFFVRDLDQIPLCGKRNRKKIYLFKQNPSRENPLLLPSLLCASSTVSLIFVLNWVWYLIVDCWMFDLIRLEFFFFYKFFWIHGRVEFFEFAFWFVWCVYAAERWRWCSGKLLLCRFCLF